MSNVPYSDDVGLVTAAQARDGDAFGRLCDRWSDPVFDVVVRIVRDREIAADVSEAVFVVAWQNLRELSEPASFGSWLLRAARHQALDALEQDGRSVARGDEEMVSEADRSRSRADAAADAEQADPVDLVWAVSAALGERDTSVLSLHLRHGITGEDLAEELGTRPDATNTSMFRLRTALGDAVQAWALWHGGQPTCDRLRSVLSAAAVPTFGRDAVRVISSHTKGCGVCASARAEMVSPEELFAAVRIVAAPVGLKADVVAAVEAQGIRPDSTGAARPIVAAGRTRGVVATGSAPGPPVRTAPDDRRATPARDGHQSVANVYAKLPHTASWLVAAALLLLVPALGAIVWIADVGEVNLARLTGTPDTSVSTTQPDASSGEQSAPTEDTGTITPSSTTTPGGPDDATTGSTTSQPAGDNPTPSSSSTSLSTSSSSSSSTSSSTSTTSSSTSTTNPSTSTTPPPAPTVDSFTASRRPPENDGCLFPRRRIELVWDTTNADEVLIDGSGAPDGPQEPDGTASFCSSAAEFVLAANGPGGSDTASARL